MRGASDQLQRDVPRFGELIRTAECPHSIGVPTARVAARSEDCESTSVYPERLRDFDSNEQTGDSVTIFDPVFTPGDVSYLGDDAGYVVLSVSTEQEVGDPSLQVVSDGLCSRSRLSRRITRPNWIRWRICRIATCPSLRRF